MHILNYKFKHRGEEGGEIAAGIEQNYMSEVILNLDNSNSKFKMNFLLAIVAASFWFKVLMML